MWTKPLSLSAMGPGRRGCPLALLYATDEQAGGVDLRAADEAAGGRSGVLAGCYLRAK
jgi:hypothetical protein